MKFASLLPRFRVSDLTPYRWSEFWGALHRGNTANVYWALIAFSSAHRIL